MSTDQIHLERRAAQRFELHLPVTIRKPMVTDGGQGVTQDLSGQGALLYTDFPLSPGDSVELTLVMPKEITLTENMRVCCRGKIMRVLPPNAAARGAVAVHIERYEFLADTKMSSEASACFARISALHERPVQDESPIEAKRPSRSLSVA